MTAELYLGHRTWSLQRDEEGHRTYTVVHQVRASTSDGPGTVMVTPGLPLVGSFWNFFNDFDPWAFCYPTMTVTPRISNGEANTHWDVKQIFSTKPLFRCQDQSIEDPLLEPDKVSGSFVNYLKEANQDKDGNLFMSSSHEPIIGPQAEFDDHRATVTIEQNRSVLGLSTFTNLINKVNDASLWGLAARKIKLSNVSWSRKLFGLCDFYYTRNLQFDIQFDTFDRVVLDEGTMVLSRDWNAATGVWDDLDVAGVAPVVTNLTHFIKAKDPGGEPVNVVLDGAGRAALTEAAAGQGTLDYYPEGDFLTLGIPTSF
jgi:hypothetical protein